MELSVSFIILLFAIGFFGSFISGMVGIGGSIIKYPMLLFIPPMLGFAAFNAHEVSGISAVQVFFATIGGVWAFRKGGYLKKDLILIMGLTILAGSFIGGYGSKMMTGDQINMVYASLATIATVMMFLPKKDVNDLPLDQITYNKTLAGILAFIIGIAAGIVGAAGAFMVVPVMLVVLKIPTRVTIATSLGITFLSSIGSTVGKVVTGQVLLWPAIIMVIASLLAAPLGANASKKINPKILEGILAALILGTAIKIWTSIL